MKHITVADATLCGTGAGYSFKEKLEIARNLERLNADMICLPAISDPKTDTLLVRTLSSFVRGSVLSVAAGETRESIENAVQALSRAEKASVRIELPVSAAGMEYIGHRKPPKMLEWIAEAVALARQSCPDTEFCALDAARAEPEFLAAAVQAAVGAGAARVCLCDTAAALLPDAFARFAGEIARSVQIPVFVGCSDKNGLAAASAVLALQAGAAGVRTAVGGDEVPLQSLALTAFHMGAGCGFETGLRYTELHRILGRIGFISGEEEKSAGAPAELPAGEENVLMHGDSAETVNAAVEKLGYFLSPEDSERVYAEVCRMTEKMNVGQKELEAIIASVDLQAVPTYTLKTFVINNGNVFPSSAQITLEKDGRELTGISVGNGPVDAAFRAIDQITGLRYELDDFQIQAVTEGKEAVGSALVRLRSSGKLYSGQGVSTDIIGASIRAYLAAVNKAVFGEG